MVKYDFQKSSKIPYLEIVGFKTLIKLKKRRFRYKDCGKMKVAETPLVKLIEKVSITAIAEQLSVSTSTVIRKLKEFPVQDRFSRYELGRIQL